VAALVAVRVPAAARAVEPAVVVPVAAAVETDRSKA
jgi:hypothetical protein